MSKQANRQTAVFLESERAGNILIPIALISIALVVALSGCSLLSRKGQVVEKQAFDIMDTYVSVMAYGAKAEEAIEQAIAEMRRLDSLLSAYDPDSEVSAINRMAGEAPVKVSDDTLAVIQTALYFAEISGGVFDPTILPVSRLWAAAREQAQLPAREEVAAALELVDYRLVQLDPDAGTVFLPAKGMGLDLGAIAKGYAVEKMAEILRASGVESFLIDAGGNVYVGGRKPDNSLWRVGVTDPRNTADILGVMSAEDMAVVSSGDYRRYFVVDNTVYHHIIDPRTWYTSDTKRGTTVYSPSSAEADALSTITFILGPDDGEGILSQFDGIGVIFVRQDGSVVTKGLVDAFEFK